MANQRYVLEFSLKDVGSSLKSGKKDADAFRGSLESIQKITSKPAAKGKGGWKNAMMGSNEYDVARGSAGATGASGRDFANQARGLDGLVRLYATYAANVFAAGAAFRALSDAADTTNMIQGMNQLGAASGQALGSIAKKLMDATDGAISMREAVEATTKGTAAGLSAKQMEQLGQVANKASKALGIAMPDAISRLTRGISKLEPELLDELGLFTKIGPATENYARSIGKTTSSLSDFERRQAFANAVLKEGIDKFNSIDIPANPYDKLLASLKNLSYEALNLSNKALVPLVNVLSQNPTALLAVLTAIGVSIVKSAIPALGHYRDNLKRTTAESGAAFQKMYSDQQTAISNMAIDSAAQAEYAYKQAAKQQAKIKALQQSGSKFTDSSKIKYSELGGKSAYELTDNDINALRMRAKTLKMSNATEAAEIEKHLLRVQRLRSAAAAKGTQVSEVVINQSEERFSQAGLNDRINQRALGGLVGPSMRSTAAQTQSLVGMRVAWAQLTKDIDLAKQGFYKVQTGVDDTGKAIMTTTPKINDFTAGWIKFTAGAGMVVQKLGTIISAFGNIGMAIGAVFATFGLVDAMFTKTEKESGAFKSALDGVSESVANTTRTLAALERQPAIASATISGISALATASQTTVDAIETQIDATNALLKALSSSTWDSAKDKIASVWGGDAISKAADELAKTVQSQLALFRKLGMGDEAESAFKQAIGVESLDIETVGKKFKESSEAQANFVKGNKILNNQAGQTKDTLQNFKTATDAVTKAYEDFIQSTASSNPMFKLGAALEDVGSIMENMSTGSLKQLNAAFNDLVDKPTKIAQFGSVFVNQFAAIRQEFKATLEQSADYEDSINNIKIAMDKSIAARERLKEELPRAQSRGLGSGQFEQGQIAELDKDIEGKAAGIKKLEEIKLGLDTGAFAKASALFGVGINAAFTKGAEYIKIALGDASAKAALTVAQAGVGALSGAEAAKETGRIKQEELKLQLRQVNSTIDLIASNALLTATLNEGNTLIAEQKAQKDGTSLEKSETTAARKAAEITKKGLESVAGGAIKPEDLAKILTGDPAVDKYIKATILPIMRSTAQQNATATELGGKQKATDIETARAERLGELETLNKQRSIMNDIDSLSNARLDILSSISDLNSAGILEDKQGMELVMLRNKQLQEVEEIETKIENAQNSQNAQSAEAVRKLTIQLNLVKMRQEKETDNKGLESRVKLQAAELQDAIKLNALKEALIDQDIARLSTLNSLVGFSTEENVLATSRLEKQKLENKFALERKAIENAISILAEQTDAKSQETLGLKRQELSYVLQRQQAEKDNKGLQDQLKLIETRIDYEQKLAGFRKTRADAESQQAEDELGYRKQLGLVTEQEFAKEKATLDRGRIARETAEARGGMAKEIANRDLLQNRINEIESEPGIAASSDDITSVNKMTTAINAQAASIDAVEKQKYNAVNTTEALSGKMAGFSNIVENSFQSMGDALAEFARTGKLDFKSLVDQMLMDLIRFELRAQMSALYAGAGGLSGMLTSVASIFAPTVAAVPSAKGNVFDTGLTQFAKGGMFTNSIVDQPTLFKFAQGTGLMGEAGPEAIMPLKRDNNGNLGVRGGNGGNVDVVVNNYSTEKATTRETMDSRGNRRIEVMVGDMVAGELNRVGSNTQQAMTSSYGTAPLLARR